MIKAMLIVMSVGGAGNYSVEMPTIEQCLEARKVIASQDMTINTLCIPKINDTDKFSKFFSMFTKMVREIKDMELDNDGFTSDKDREINSKCNICSENVTK